MRYMGRRMRKMTWPAARAHLGLFCKALKHASTPAEAEAGAAITPTQRQGRVEREQPGEQLSSARRMHRRLSCKFSPSDSRTVGREDSGREVAAGAEELAAQGLAQPTLLLSQKGDQVACKAKQSGEASKQRAEQLAAQRPGQARASSASMAARRPASGEHRAMRQSEGVSSPPPPAQRSNQVRQTRNERAEQRFAQANSSITPPYYNSPLCSQRAGRKTWYRLACSHPIATSTGQFVANKRSPCWSNTWYRLACSYPSSTVLLQGGAPCRMESRCKTELQ